MTNVIELALERAKRSKARHVQGTVAAFSKVAFGSEILDRDFDEDSLYAEAIRAVAFSMSDQ